MNINEPVVHIKTASRYPRMPRSFGGVTNFHKAGDHSGWVQAPKENGEYVDEKYIKSDQITVMNQAERDAVDALESRSNYESLLFSAGDFRYPLLPDHPTEAEALEHMPLGGKYLLMEDGIATQWGLRMGDGICSQESSHATDGSLDQVKRDFNIKTRVERTDRKNHSTGKWTETSKIKPIKERPKKVK